MELSRADINNAHLWHINIARIPERNFAKVLGGAYLHLAYDSVTKKKSGKYSVIIQSVITAAKDVRDLV